MLLSGGVGGGEAEEECEERVKPYSILFFSNGFHRACSAARRNVLVPRVYGVLPGLQVRLLRVHVSRETLRIQRLSVRREGRKHLQENRLQEARIKWPW